MRLSALPKTWLIDLDGTIFEHNGYLNGGDRLLPGVRELWARIAPQDRIVVLTARGGEHEAAIRRRLAAFGLRVDDVLCGLGVGERILVNDRKPSGLATAYAVNVARDAGLADLQWTVDPEL